MKGCLRSKDGNAVHQLRNTITTVGREGCDIILPYSTIEKQHALIDFDVNQSCFILQDLNSANGTYVNEHRVQNSAVRLAPGDIIRFGFGNPGYEFGIDSMSVYSSNSSHRQQHWMNGSYSSSISLPYITTALSSMVETGPIYHGPQNLSLPGGLVPSETQPRDSWGGGVMPHPPLRSRPASAGQITKPRPGSGGRERTAMVARGGWIENGVSSLNTSSQQSVEELEERLLRMGDELSRLASYEAECHRKDGIINSLRDEVSDLKSKLTNQTFGFRAGGEDSAFSNVGIVSELRQQVSQLQAMLKEKEHKIVSFQEQLHTRNEELNTLKSQLDSKVQYKPIEVEQDPHANTNTFASLRTQLAEKDKKIAQLTHDIDKLNKQKTQTTTLLNTLQRENSAKDSVVQQAKIEIEKLKKQLREKDVTLSTISAKLSRQKLIREAEVEAEKKEKELTSCREKLLSTEKQLKDRNRQVNDLQNELERVKSSISENKQSCSDDSLDSQRTYTVYNTERQTTDPGNKQDFFDTGCEIEAMKSQDDLTSETMASQDDLASDVSGVDSLDYLLFEENRQLAMKIRLLEQQCKMLESDKVLQQELDHAKAQFLDANRAEKLLKVDMQQLEKRFDRFRRKAIQNIHAGGNKLASNKELDDEEILDLIKDLAQENVKLGDEIRHYAEAEERTQTQKADMKDAMGALRKDMENMERHLSKYGRDCNTLEEELTKLEELYTHETLLWIKDVISRLLTHEISWQKRSEETMRRAGVNVDDDEEDGAPTVESLCRLLKKLREQNRQLQARITEMEETHQDTIVKLRQDAKYDEERKIARAVAEVKTEEEEKRHHVIQEMRVQEQERIREAVETERRILESQHGSVTQLQQTLSEKEQELLRYKRALSEAKTQYEQAKNDLITTKESESFLQTQLQELVASHEAQLNKVIKEREELRNYKQDEVTSFKEQTRQHAHTIVAMEERLLLLTKQNKQLELELAYYKQGGKHRPSSPRKVRPLSPQKERPSSPTKETRPHSPRKESKQTRSVETETIPQTNVEASLKSDVYKLEQLVLLLRREASQAKKEATAQADVVQALRRDLAGASARMSDMAGELSDKQKQQLEENEERIREQDRELEELKKQLSQLSLLVDEQQRQIEHREVKLNQQEAKIVKHHKDSVKKNLQLVEYTDVLEKAVEDQVAHMEQIEKENKNTSDLCKVGMRCRGERHDQVIARQKEALMDMRKKAKLIEQLKPPLPSHEQSLQQIVALKSELSELRASIANKEEDYHKTESEMHAEVVSRKSASHSVVDSQSSEETLYLRVLPSGAQLRLLREKSSSNLVETNFEKSAHKDTQIALDLSEKTYLKLARTLAALLEIDPLPGSRTMAHLPIEERERLQQERDQAVDLMVGRVKRLHERLDRKEKLLGSYEDDLVNLRETQTVAGMKTAEARGLKIDVRDRQEEIAYLRESLTRTREDLDQQRRLNKCLRERKKFAMDYEDRDHHHIPHSCYQDEHTRYQEEKKKKKESEKMKRKNYEIESLKKELRLADSELNNTALKLQALESSRSGRNLLEDIPTIELEDV